MNYIDAAEVRGAVKSGFSPVVSNGRIEAVVQQEFDDIGVAAPACSFEGVLQLAVGCGRTEFAVRIEATPDDIETTKGTGCVEIDRRTAAGQEFTRARLAV